MSDTRDERIEKRLEKMSTLFEHSDKKEQKSEVIKLEEAKSDILNELPADVVRYLLLEGYPYGDNIESLRNAYIDYKKEHAKLEYQASGHFENKERRQDNVREYEIPDNDRQRQRDLYRTRSRSYERGMRVHA